jgi:hypothetical protein
MTAMQMHPYFTEIPLRSFEAMAFEGHLSEVLLALIVDPHEAEDVSRMIRDIYSTRIELDFDGKITSAPITLSDFQDLPSKHAFEQLKITLAQWVMTTERADSAVGALASWDRRFGVWCACAAARDALRFVPEDEERPLRAIEAAEAWVRGMATRAQVSAAREAARAAARAAYAAFAAARAADAAYYAADRASAAAAADAARAAYAAAADAAADAARVAELVRLREVVANACLTFPG